MPGVVYRQIMKTNRSSIMFWCIARARGATAIKAFIAMVRAGSRNA
jgi:hypothetical protein